MIIYKILFLLFCFISSVAFANYPKVSGDLILNLGFDKISDSNHNNIKKQNLTLESQADLALNINRNWSVKTLWQSRRITKDYYLNKQLYNPIIATDNRQISVDDESIFIEELKLNFKNEDLEFFIGKFNPHFGNAWDKKRRSSIFAVFFGRDYQLREKVGFALTALFDSSELSFYSFFNDDTDLSNSAINRRGRNKRIYKVAGNNGSLSSYVIKLSGKNFFRLKDLSYHFAYKKIDVDTIELSKETGYTLNFEYLYKLSQNVSLIPFYEIVKTNNINGKRGSNSIHQTLSLNFNYSSWDLMLSYFTKNIDGMSNEVSDKYIEYNIGYRISDNMRIGFSRINTKENDASYNVNYLMFSYIKEF